MVIYILRPCLLLCAVTQRPVRNWWGAWTPSRRSSSGLSLWMQSQFQSLKTALKLGFQRAFSQYMRNMGAASEVSLELLPSHWMSTEKHRHFNMFLNWRNDHFHRIPDTECDWCLWERVYCKITEADTLHSRVSERLTILPIWHLHLFQSASLKILKC